MKDTLCWDCRKSTNKGCPWSKSFETVEGWEAIKIKNKDIYGETYCVRSCPLFEDNSKRALRIEYFEKYFISPATFYYLINNGFIDKNGVLLKTERNKNVWQACQIQRRKMNYLKRRKRND